MLRIANPSPSGAIFQAIVLPRLAALRPVTPRCSVFCTTSVQKASVVDTTTPKVGQGYPPWEAPPPTSAKLASPRPESRVRTARNDHRPIPPPPPSPTPPADDFWVGLSGSSRTALAAAQRIINTHIPPPSRAAGKQRDDSPNTTSTGATSNSPSTSTASPEVTEALPFPPPIYALLRQRLFRLAVFQILKTAEYATDPRLVEDTAAYLDRGGAGKLAARLRKSCSKLAPSPSSNRPLSASLHSPLKNASSSTALTDVPQKVRIRLWSEPEPKDRARRPPDHWRYLSTISSASIPPLELPPSLYPTSTSTSASTSTARRAALRALSPSQKAERQRALTAYYNHHLSRLVSSPSTHPDPFGIAASSSGRPVAAPGPSLHQLHALTARIRQLEKCRGFKPDRVTANILVKCWLRCGLALDPQPSRRRVGTNRWVRKSPSASEGWREEDLRAMWALMRRLMSLGPTAPRMPDQIGRPKPTAREGEGKEGEGEGELLEYGKHIRPFCGMIINAARSLGAWDLVEEVLSFQSQQRRILRPDLVRDEKED